VLADDAPVLPADDGHASVSDVDCVVAFFGGPARFTPVVIQDRAPPRLNIDQPRNLAKTVTVE